RGRQMPEPGRQLLTRELELRDAQCPGREEVGVVVVEDRRDRALGLRPQVREDSTGKRQLGAEVEGLGEVVDLGSPYPRHLQRALVRRTRRVADELPDVAELRIHVEVER